MKKLILFAFLAISASSFAQTEKNGTIYKKHPYIDAVVQSISLFAKGDTVGAAKLYADSVTFLDSSSPKSYKLAAARAGWKEIFDNWEQIKITPVGYPDALEYKADPFTVQSWWKVSCVNKKTKKTAVFEQVVFDMFNKSGKVVVESTYYDTSSIIAAMK